MSYQLSAAELKDLGTRALWTFTQVTLSALLISGSLNFTATAAGVAALAGAAAVFSLTRAYLSYKLEMFGTTSNSAYEIVWRVVFTFLAAAVGALATGTLTDITVWQGAGVAGLTAAFDLIKTIAGDLIVRDAPTY